MKVKTILVPLTMPLVLAACLGGGGGSGGSGWRNFTSFDNINPNQRVQFQSGGGSVNYAGTVTPPATIVGRDGAYSNEGARVRIRFGPDISENPEEVDIEINSLELTVNLPNGNRVVRTFDGDSVVNVGTGAAADRFVIYEVRTEPEDEPPSVLTDRFYVEQNDDLDLDYMTFGLWELGLDGTERNIGGAAFGRTTLAFNGGALPVDTVTYEGDLIGYQVTGSATTVYVADSELVANFAATPTVTLTSFNTQTLGGTEGGFLDISASGTITGDTFSGTNLTLGTAPAERFEAAFGGAFFGPAAEEAGGWFEVRNVEEGANLNDRYFGSFGGARGEIAEP